MGAFRFLLARSASNAFASLVAGLRRPWRALVRLVAVGYLAGLSRLGTTTAAPDPHQATNLGALGVLVLVATGWIFGSGAGATSPHGAWRDLLLPAPVSRGALVDLLLLRSQAFVLLNVVLWTAIASRNATPGTLLLRAASLWFLFTLLVLHRALIARARGTTTGGWQWLRRAGFAAGLLLLVAVPFLLSGSGALHQGLLFEASGPGRVVLDVFSLPVRPLMAGSPGAWLAAAWPAALLVVGHYLLLRWLGPDSEPHRAATMAAGAPLLRLTRATPDASIRWKAVTATTRRARALWVALAILTLVAVLGWMVRAGAEERAAFTGFLLLTWAPIVLVSGAQFLPNGLRRDAAVWTLMRTMPVRSHQWILGGALGAGAIVGTIVTALLGAGLTGTLGSPEIPWDTPTRSALAFAAALAVFPLAVLSYIANDWVALAIPVLAAGAQSRGGTTRLGSSLLATCLSLVAMLLALVPALALALVAWEWLPATEPARIMASGLAGAVVLTIECILASRLVGALFDRGAREASG